MIVKTKTVLKKIGSKEAVEGENKKPLTIGEFLCNLLSMSVAEDAHKSYELAKKFGTQDEVKLKSEDIVYIKKVISTSRIAPLTAGQTIGILEGTSDEDNEEDDEEETEGKTNIKNKKNKK